MVPRFCQKWIANNKFISIEYFHDSIYLNFLCFLVVKVYDIFSKKNWHPKLTLHLERDTNRESSIINVISKWYDMKRDREKMWCWRDVRDIGVSKISIDIFYMNTDIWAKHFDTINPTPYEIHSELVCYATEVRKNNHKKIKIVR